MTDLPAAAITAAMAALAAHRWKSMSIASVECECGEIINGQSIATGPSFDPDGPGYETAAFPADETFRHHLAGATLEAAAPHLTAADPTTETEGFRAYKAALAAGRAEGTAAERQRIIRLASQMRASIPADHPQDAEASFADYLRVTSQPDEGDHA